MLAAHDDVAEAAVIGVPDAVKGEVIEAYVVPRAGLCRQTLRTHTRGA